MQLLLRRRVLIAALATSCATSVPVMAAPDEDLADLSLEELLETEVLTASRRGENLIGVGAAVTVITREDIRRSGARSVPEALRLVPGIQVSRIHSNAWAISSRGFAGRLSNKLLVMIDGRSIYTPTFSGVHWEAHDLLLEDVERIEVVRGPGGTMWGANAVNGVINVITRDARDTRGLYVEGGGGDRRSSTSMARVGGGSERGAWRVYGQMARQDGFDGLDGAQVPGDLDLGLVGLRADGDVGEDLRWRVMTEMREGRAEETIGIARLTPPYDTPTLFDSELHGGHVLSQVELDRHGRWTLRAYFDDTGRESSFLDEHRKTVDAELQHGFDAGRHELMWGLGWRRESREADDTRFVSFLGDGHHRQWMAFAQDRIGFLDDRLQVTVGTKYEDHADAPADWQPSARAVWSPQPTHATWAAVSRAVRAPSALDREIAGTFDVYAPSAESMGLPVSFDLLPAGDRFRAETMIATELGHRRQLGARWQVDVSLFHHRYRDLGAFTLLPPQPVLDAPTPYVSQPMLRANALEGESAGGELGVAWQVRDPWRLRVQYALTSIALRSNGTAAAVVQSELASEERGTPRHQGQIISWLDLGRSWEFDHVVTVYSRNHAQDIASWVRWDARIGVHLSPEIDLSFVGQNLLRTRHREWTGNLEEVPTQPGRTLFVGVTWRND